VFGGMVEWWNDGIAIWHCNMAHLMHPEQRTGHFYMPPYTNGAIAI